MSAPDLLTIAADWSYWDAPPGGSIPRNIILPNNLRPDVVLVIQGVRRCGKSTLLGQLLGRYELDRRRCLFINFEDPRLAGGPDYTLLQSLVDAFEANKEAGPFTYFLDEIQHVAGWERWLRVQLDRPSERQFVVTGSNAHLLSGELASTLTGRHIAVELFPFDLQEARLAAPDLTLDTFLHEGGFPAPLGSDDGDLLRRGYFNDIVERDVRERVAARSTTPLRQLAQILFESAGSELSARRLAAALGVAPDTAALYIDAMQSAYMAFECPYFDWSERKRAVRNKKYYPIDTGLRRVASTRTGADRGKMLECATYIQLRRRFRDIYYWRDGGEVDFVVLDGDVPRPIQVSWDGPKERHHRALDAFYATHRQSTEALFITAESFEDPSSFPRPGA